jgi:hypothetical protein
MAAPQIVPASLSLSAPGPDAAPAVAVDDSTRRGFVEALMATMTGRQALTDATDRKTDDADDIGKDEKQTAGT